MKNSSMKALGILALSTCLTPLAFSAPQVELVIRDHLFYPSELEIPAGVKVRLMIFNEDPTAEEFESYELNREKVVLGNSKTVVFIGPLSPGEYPFFGEFNMSTAQGKVIVK